MTATTNRKSRAAIKREISDAYYTVLDLLCSTGGNYELEKARELAAKGERQHRAFGRRLVGDIGTRATVHTCAQYFALRAFATPISKHSVDAREDYIAGYCARKRAVWGAKCSPNKRPSLRRATALARKVSSQIDYVRDLTGEG